MKKSKWVLVWNFFDGSSGFFNGLLDGFSSDGWIKSSEAGFFCGMIYFGNVDNIKVDSAFIVDF